MNILVIGSGGREHALVWKIRQSPLAEQIHCIPGNAGIETLARCHNLSVNDFDDIEAFIRKNDIGFTVIGPEQPLVNGLADYLETRGHAVFGPSREAAQMEGSKIFSKNLMKKYGIPTAGYETFEEAEQALAYLDSLPDGRIVVKADGLAAGKGAIVCMNLEEARDAVRGMMLDHNFADAGSRVVIEEFMEGREASLFVLTDGNDYRLLSPAQDYKRAFDGDRGKNTGGMGSYAPTPVLTKTMFNRAVEEIVEPTLAALKSEGIEYRGVLYCGLMVTNKGPKVVEFNCRFGDPETQVVLPLLESDLLELMIAVQKGTLGKTEVRVKDGSAVCVIAASGGYPDAYAKGRVISGLDTLDDEVVCFHAGTRREEDHVVTSGGRVLAVSAVHADLQTAIRIAYRNMERISFEGMFYRKDIARSGWQLGAR